MSKHLLMWQSIFHRINQPYPDIEKSSTVVFNMFLAGLIVFLILYLFQPFGLGQVEEGLLLTCGVFGLITFVVGLLYELVFLRSLPIKRDSPRWTFKHWLVSVLGLVWCIAIANYVTIYFLFNGQAFDWTAFFQMLLNTFLVALFPIAIAGLVHQNRALQKHLKEANQMEPDLAHLERDNKPVRIESKEQKDTFTGMSNELFLIEAMQNYVVIHFEEEGQVKKQMLRNSLSNTCRQICDQKIIRCHRSFIVNMDKVRQVEGNAQGLTLFLDHDLTAPVSRSYIKAVRTAGEKSEQV